MTEMPPRQWLRRPLWITGLLVVTLVFATVATFNARTARPNLNFKVPDSLLLQIRADDKSGWLTFVIANQGRTWFVVPREAVLSNGVTVQTIETTARSLNLDQTAAALESLLNVEFDEVWQVDRLGLSAFVEAAGGVIVTPKVDGVISPATAEPLAIGGGSAINLSGMYASTYAVDPSIATNRDRYRRFDQVFSSLMARLDAGTLTTALPAIGSASRSSMDQAELISFIEKLQQLRAVRKPRVIMLPTITATYNGEEYLYLLTAARTALIKAGVHERITP